MPYEVAYSINYLNYDPSDKTETAIGVNLYDGSTFTSDPIDQAFIALEPSANPVQLSYLDTNEDIFTPIRGRRAALSFLSGISLDINTFAKGADNNWIAEIIVGATFIFKGFLVIDDLRMRFVSGKNPVLLDMTDGLATLSDIPLTNDDLTNVSGYYSIIELIALCLKKTGQSLPIHVVNSINPGSGSIVEPTGGVNFHGSPDEIRIVDTYSWFPYVGQRIVVSGSPSNDGTFTVTAVTTSTGTTFISVAESIVGEFPLTGVTLTDESSGRLFEKNFLEAKTFEKKIGESEDCRTVLDKIMSAFGAFVCQNNSEWWIFAVDDFRHTQYIRDNYTFDGVYVDSTTESSDKVIGEGEMFMEGASSDVSLRRPAKQVEIEYMYEFPEEIPCNVDFSRGDVIDDTDPLLKTYEIECWTVKRGVPGAYNTPITTTAYIKRIFNVNDYEVERYIVLTPQTGHSGFSSTDDEYIESEAIPIEVKDKFIASIDWRLNTNLTTSSTSPRLFRMILHGEDGSYWILGNGPDGPLWFNTSGMTANTGEGTITVVFSAQDETEWQNITWEAPPAPVGGDLYIWINQFYQSATTGVNTEVYYSNLSFEYIPFINGSYRKYTGHQHKLNQLTEGYKPVVTKRVYIAEGIKKLFKGALHSFNGTAYVLAADFHNSRDGASAGFGVTRHGKLLANAYWNQYLDNMRKFDLTLRGLQTDSEEVPGLVDRFILNDTNVSTTNRKFMAVAMSQNLRDTSWTAIMWEVYSTVRGYEWDGDKYSFKYLT